MCILMEPIYEATKFLSSSSYPTQRDLRIAFTIIMEMLELKMIKDPPTTKDGTCNCFLKSAILRIFDQNYDMCPQIRNCPQF